MIDGYNSHYLQLDNLGGNRQHHNPIIFLGLPVLYHHVVDNTNIHHLVQMELARRYKLLIAQLVKHRTVIDFIQSSMRPPWWHRNVLMVEMKLL